MYLTIHIVLTFMIDIKVWVNTQFTLVLDFIHEDISSNNVVTGYKWYEL